MSNGLPTNLILPIGIEVARVLRERAGLLGVVPKDMDDIPAGVGESVQVGIAPKFGSAGTVTPAAYLASLPSDRLMRNRTVSLATWSKAEFYLTSREQQKIAQSGEFISRNVEEAVVSVLKAIRTGLYAAMLKFDGYVCATTGTSLINSTDGLSNLVAARGKLRQQECPTDGRILVLAGVEEDNALNNAQFIEAAKSGAGESNPAFREGLLGRVLGFEVHGEDGSDLPYAHTCGTYDGGNFNGGEPAGEVDLVEETGSGTILENDIIAAGNDETGRLVNTYAVTTALGSHTVSIGEPGLRLAVADDLAFKVMRSDDNYYIRGWAFHPYGLRLVGRTCQQDGALGAHQIITDPVTGLKLKLSVLPADEAVVWRVSLLWGAGVFDPRLGCRLVAAQS